MNTFSNFFGQNPTTRNYGVNDGLASSMVYRAFQDSQGLMWFCTTKGISRFDGYNFETFTINDGIPHNDVWQIAEDTQKRVWFLSYSSHFFYYDLQQNRFVVIKNPYSELKDGHVWGFIQQDKNLYTAVLSENQEVLSIDSHTQKVRRFSPTRRGIYEYPFDTTVAYFNHYKAGGFPFELRAYSEGFSHNLNKRPHPIPNKSVLQQYNSLFQGLLAIIFDDNTTICASEHEIIQDSGSSVIHANVDELSQFPDDKIVLIMNVGNPKYKFCKTEKDAFIIDNQLNRIHSFDFLRKYILNSVTFDQDENLWICTKNHGVFFLSKDAVKSHTLTAIEGAVISSARLGTETWIGTNSGQIYYTDTNGKFIKLHFQNPINLPINNLVVTPEYLIFTWQGLIFGVLPYQLAKQGKAISSIFHPKNQHSANFKISVADKTKLHVIQWHDIKSLDRISPYEFVASNALNIAKLKIYKDIFYSEPFIPKDLIAKALAVKTSPDSTIWVGNSQGVFQVKNIKQQRFTPLLSVPVKSLAYANKLKTLLIGTNGYGLYFRTNGKIGIFKELMGEIINHLYFDEKTNHTWVATNHGVYILQHKAKQPQHYTISRLLLNNGLPSLEVNQIAINERNAFVGTSAGLVKYTLDLSPKHPKNLYKLPLSVRNVWVNQQKQALQDVYELAYDHNNIKIQYAGISFPSDKKNTYYYQFGEPSKTKEWESTSAVSLEFVSLPPGNYEFILKCVDLFQRISKTQKIRFIIKPPFWQTPWFAITFLLLMFGITYWVIVQRIKHVKIKVANEHLIEKRMADLQLEALQGQMNPHFVFNVLSSIQYFILQNDPISASSYLSKFSRLMRLFLESLRNKFIYIPDEVTLLSNYLALEQLRLSNKFTFSVEVSPDILPSYKIPTMLIQPFVENAINHGILHSTKPQNTIHIRFEVAQQKIICTVDDDGIGREQARIIKEQQTTNIISRGTEITFERIKSLRQSDNIQIDIIYTDKNNTANPYSTGTIVQIITDKL